MTFRTTKLAVFISLLLVVTARVQGAQPLPEETIDEPVVPLESFTDEVGWLGRWQQSHRARVAADSTGIVTDRPSFTYSSATVPKGWVQVESGYLFSTKSGHFERTMHTAPEVAVRLGLTPWLEFRAVWAGLSYLTDGQFTPFNYNESRLANLQLGFKFQVTHQNGGIPQSALITALFLPTGDGWTLPVPSNYPNQSEHVAPLIDYVYTWSVSDRTSVGGSTGGVFDSEDGFSVMEYFQSLILRHQWTPELSFFFEGYVLFGHQDNYYAPYYYYGIPRGFGYASGYDDAWYNAPYLDGGVLWRPWRNLQFDWRAGMGLNAATDNFFTGVGLSFRY